MTGGRTTSRCRCSLSMSETAATLAACNIDENLKAAKRHLAEAVASQLLGGGLPGKEDVVADAIAKPFHEALAGVGRALPASARRYVLGRRECGWRRERPITNGSGQEPGRHPLITSGSPRMTAFGGDEGLHPYVEKGLEDCNTERPQDRLRQVPPQTLLPRRDIPLKFGLRVSRRWRSPPLSPVET